MKILMQRLNLQRGQTLAIVALMMVVLLGILGLVLDGGNVLSKRRAAQNAADAGALAGARTLCLTQSVSQAEFIGNQYAVTHNEAAAADVSANLEARQVVVTATIPVQTTFAHFIGIQNITAQASAAAGCFSPTTGESVLPVGWACRPPISGELSDSEDCQEQRLTIDQLNNYLEHPLPSGEIYPELYIIMDSAAEPDDLADICMSNWRLAAVRPGRRWG